MLRNEWIATLCAAAVVLAGLPGWSSDISEETLSLTTYPFSEPDPVPIMARSGSMWGSSSRLYPYFRFDGLSAAGEPQPCAFIRMENPWIEVFITPEIGGKVWGAIEKSTGEEFIYFNHAVKFREIAMRGPWTSGGIEMNFGVVGHTPSGATPVDYRTWKDRDGTAHCAVGSIDLPSRTRWTVTISLPPDAARFETRAFWYNPTPLHQSYYVWMTSAVQAADDLQFVLPGSAYIEHNYSELLRPWPVDEAGRDLSIYRNNNFGSSKSYFTVGEYAHHAGGYWHDRGFGYGHWALYGDMPGRKTWIWSLARDGGIWEDLLTDTDGQYTEPQMGRLLNQSDHTLFAPQLGDRWREVWFPYKEIGPLCHATPAAVLNVTRTGEVVEVNLCALEPLDEMLVVRAGEVEVLREALALDPMEVHRARVPGQIEQGALRVDLGDKLSYSEAPEATALHRPLHFHNYDESTTEGLFLAAERRQAERGYHQALTKYLECIERDPNHVRALCRVAELHYRKAEYETALEYAGRALACAMYDPAANYIYGLAARRLGRLVDAKETFGWAARSLEYRSTAYTQLAELSLREGDEALARDYLRRALDANRLNLNAHQALAVVRRCAGETKEARATLDEILDLDPLNPFARFERYLLRPNRRMLEAFQSPICGELPHETYLELALFYARLGRDEEAAQVLRLAPEQAMVLIWRAYLARGTEASSALLDQACAASPDLVFPFRAESIPVLGWAIDQRPEAWTLKYYLGLVYWSMGRQAEAAALFDRCGSPDYQPFYLARAALHRGTSPDRALEDLEHAVAIAPEDWRSRHHLLAFLRGRGLTDRALTEARAATAQFPENQTITMDFVRAAVAARQFPDALAILDSAEILPYEGASEAHALFVQCHLETGIEEMRSGRLQEAIGHLEAAKTYPERLGRGAPYDPDLRIQDYLLALCFDQTGQGTAADEARRRVLEHTRAHPDRFSYAGALALRASGDEAAGLAHLEAWQQARPNDPLVAWCLATYTGRTDEAARIASQWPNPPASTTYDLALLAQELERK